jgi:aryl-alcohol dehydrogenase-like predicted oxidoreductase
MGAITGRPARADTRQGAAVGAAPPRVAAAFAAGLIYLWLEVLFRLLFTYTSLASRYTLWNGRAGDVAAMWLTISAVALVAFFVLGFGVFRGRAHVGTIPVWAILLIVSAIVAPLIGEIGTPLGI